MDTMSQRDHRELRELTGVLEALLERGDTPTVDLEVEPGPRTLEPDAIPGWSRDAYDAVRSDHRWMRGGDERQPLGARARGEPEHGRARRASARLAVRAKRHVLDHPPRIIRSTPHLV
jgi:hypothetical protein